jgi:hypothetical protein
MTSSNTVSDLAERCEAATGPDRELDCAIAVALGRTDEGGSGFHRTFPDDSVFEQVRALLFTASLDAAMTLVPEGAVWSVGNFGFDEKPMSTVGEIEVNAATPALALCAAALKARAALKQARNP